jgi:predicted metal-dependent hydrolase
VNANQRKGAKSQSRKSCLSGDFAPGRLCVTLPSAKIAALIDRHRGQELSPYYLGYFELFNAQLFYESHDVLEELWLPIRREPQGDFYKGLIQLAGAFVHLQKNRLRPSAALFKLARTNLEKYPKRHEQLDLAAVIRVIEQWLLRLEQNGFARNPLDDFTAPKLVLIER